MVKPISAKPWLPDAPSPSASAVVRLSTPAIGSPLLSSIVESPSPSAIPLSPDGPVAAFAATPAESPEYCSTSLNIASGALVPVALAPRPALCLALKYLDFIAKIKPVGPDIGCTPQISYAIKFGIALLTNAINTGFQLVAAVLVVVVLVAS